MKIGLMSDVHANVVALRTVLEDASSIETWIHAGDVVGYGPWPCDTIAVFQDREITSIQGNHDRAAIGDFHEGFTGIPLKMASWTTEQLTDEEVAYLTSLPVELNCYDDRVYICHGAPDVPNRYTYANEVDASLLGSEEVLVLGHTHEQFVREFENGAVVNPGSVGQPRDGDWRAAYAVLDLETREVELQRVEYPVEEIRSQSQEYGFPEPLIDVYKTGQADPIDFANWSGTVEE